MSAARWPHAAIAGLLLLGSCGGVSHALRGDLPAPHTLAVLPFAGDAAPAVRELARSLFAARLADLGYRLVEAECVDRVLTEHGWLGDPDRFAPASLPLEQLCTQLGVDGVLVAEALDEQRFNLLVLRRHVLGGSLRIELADRAVWWRAEHQVGGTSGLLLQSGQVLTELRAQGMHGTSAATLGLLDALLQDVAATLPRTEVPVARTAAAAPSLVATSAAAAATGTVRVVVEVDAAPRDNVWFDVGTAAGGVPMAGRAGHFTGAIDVPAADAAAPVRVRSRDPFGGEQQIGGGR